MEAFPRALSAREAAVLAHMLAAPFAGADQARRQAEALVVSGRCGCGCPSIELAVDRRRAPVMPGRGREQHESPVADAMSLDREDPFDLILFARGGWLSYLELVAYRGDQPSELPAPEAFTPAVPYGEWQK